MTEPFASDLDPLLFPASRPRTAVRARSTEPPQIAPVLRHTPVHRTFGIRRVDVNGRVLAATVVAALRWESTTALTMECVGEELLVVRAEPGSQRRVRHDRLYVPAAYRRRLRIAAHDQVLLVADPATGVLLMASVRLMADLLGDRLTEAGSQ